MKYYIVIICFFCSLTALGQTVVNYTYDSAGNRISRVSTEINLTQLPAKTHNALEIISITEKAQEVSFPNYSQNNTRVSNLFPIFVVEERSSYRLLVPSDEMALFRTNFFLFKEKYFRYNGKTIEDLL